MTTIDGIKQFLEAEVAVLNSMGNLRNRIGDYRSMGEFVLRNGVNFEPAPLPDDVRRGRMKECYKNAAQLVMGNPRRFIYCEGYACGVIPVLHAFALNTDCKVVDPTWQDGTEYFGVAIKYAYLLKSMRTHGTYGVIDQWQARWPILKDDPEKWRHPIMEEMKQ